MINFKTVLLLLFSITVLEYCTNNNKSNLEKKIFYSVDSVYTREDIAFIKKEFKLEDTIICENNYAYGKLISVKIFNNLLFEKYRDSMDLQSNRLIGLQIFSFHCSNCHEFRNNKIVNFSDDLNFVPYMLNHSKLKNNILNNDEINFVKVYLNSLKD